MKGKFGVVALIFSSITFAAPVSAPNQLSDTPIFAGGGSSGNLSLNDCRAYQTDGAAINLSGGEMLVFYGGGQWKTGGYLATKSRYSGTAYLKLNRHCSPSLECLLQGHAIGLFVRNSDAQQDFIAGAGGSFQGYSFGSTMCSPASGGGWQGEPTYCSNQSGGTYHGGGTVSHGDWFYSWQSVYRVVSPGFHGLNYGGGASSISAWYNFYTKDYTLPTTSATITGGGITGQGRLYVCQ